MTWWWSWLLAIVGITGIFLAGSKHKSGWAVGLGAQALWLAYAVVTRQWGFLVTALVYGAVYARNWLRWSRDESARETAAILADPATMAELREAEAEVEAGLTTDVSDLLAGMASRRRAA